jgi:dTDP-4-dehydrorhamnose 3,5-epimerase
VILHEVALPGVFRIDPEAHRDERGAFVRLWSGEDLAARGLIGELSQASLSTNTVAGTVRGLHLQAPPYEETKIVGCLRGAIWDVIVDLRPGSPTRGRWTALELRPDPPDLLYIPAGCAHGFQTLDDDSAVFYAISQPYVAEAARGVRFDDPTLAIPWPRPVTVVSARDRALPTLA